MLWVLTQNTEKKYALVFNVNNLRDSKQEINFNTAYVNIRVIRYYYTVTETVSFYSWKQNTTRNAFVLK